VDDGLWGKDGGETKRRAYIEEEKRLFNPYILHIQHTITMHVLNAESPCERGVVKASRSSSIWPEKVSAK